MKNWRNWLVVIALVFLMTGSSLGQCAMCRGTVESTMSNGRNLVATGLNAGILYLLAMPYLVVSVIAYLWYRNSRKAYGQRVEITSRVRRALS